MNRPDHVRVAGTDWHGWVDLQPVDQAGQRHATVQIEGGEPVLVPLEMLVPQGTGEYSLPVSRAELTRGASSTTPAPRPAGGSEELVIPLVREEIDIRKQRWETGGVRVEMEVREREEIVDQPMIREEVTVERVPVNRVVQAAPAVRQEGHTTVIPVLEEVLVVEKRLVLKEEVRITKRQFEAHEPQTVVLRSEEPRVERLHSDSGSNKERHAA